MIYKSVRLGMLFLGLLVLFYPAFSQPVSVQFRHLNISDGLSSNDVYAICQDKEGFLWIGNISGLNRYDGKHFLVFRHSYSDSKSIASNICLGLCIDSSDNIWVRSSYSISCLDRKTGAFINYFLKDANGKIITSQEIFSGFMAGKDGRVIISSSQYGFLEVDKTRKELVRINFNGIPAGIENKQKIVSASGVIGFKADSIFYISLDDGAHFFEVLNNKELPPDRKVSVFNILNKSGNHLWIGDLSGAVSAYIIEVDIGTRQSNTFQLPVNYLIGVNNYDENTFWLGCWSKGLIHYNRKTGKYKLYSNYKDDASSLSSDLVKFLFIDKEGVLWIGSSAGIDYCTPNKRNIISVNHNVRGFEKLGISEIESMAEDTFGRIWIGLLDYNVDATNGLICYDPKTGSYKTFFAHSAARYGIWRILPEGNHLLLSTQQGLAEFDLKTEKFTNHLNVKFPTDIINNKKGFTILNKDHNGIYWLGIWRKGLLKFNAKTGEDVYFNTKTKDINRQLSEDLVNQMSVDAQNNIWLINSANNILEYINNKANKVIHIPVGFNGQPFTDKFQCIQVDVFGHVWIGTIGGGLIRYSIDDHRFSLYTTEDGLPDLFVHAMVVDQHNRLWVFTSNGLAWIDLTTNKIHAVDRRIIQSPLGNGDNPLLFTKDGYLYLGGTQGFLYFHPNDIILTDQLRSPIPVAYHKMNQAVFFSQTQTALKVYPGEDNISVSFVSPDLLHGSEIEYAYRLYGYEDQWEQVGNEGIAKFIKLPPGKFELQMRATFRGAKWDGKYSSLSIIVYPFFYQTWWFRSFLFLLALFLIAWIIYYVSTRRLRKNLAKLRQQQQINDLRNRIAGDIHDEIGAGLTRITIRSELVKLNKQATPEDYLDVLKSINRQSHELVTNLGEIVWTINPQQDKLDNMLAYFRHFIHQFMQGLPMQYTIHFPEVIPDILIHPDIKRNLFLILKESINNAVKHAQADMLVISFSLTNHRYTLTIADNGKGINADEVKEFGNGIKGIKSRAKRMHAQASILSDNGGGTQIVVEGTFYKPS